MSPDRCPACDADFDGGPIPEGIRHHYSPPYRWSRRIAVVDRGLDRRVAWKCPDCGHEWNGASKQEKRAALAGEAGHGS